MSCAVSASLPILARGVCMVTSVPFRREESLSYLGAMCWFFIYFFSEKSNILICPCKKAVMWSCKNELTAYLTWTKVEEYKNFILTVRMG